jgi:ABC-type antimicrobial peptide transport system permease subunit
MSSNSPATTAASIRRAVPSAQVALATNTGGEEIIRSATTVLWIGTIGTGAFAVIALIAAILALLRRRTVETRALRALGLAARRQAQLRRREVGIVALVAALSGALTGAGVALVVTGTMARLSTPDAASGLPLRLEFDAVPILVTVALLGAAIVGSAIGYGASVLRQARGGS